MGGVGCGPPPTTGNAPPRASFFGLMSLSLVLADFGTLVFCFFLVVIFYSLFLVLFLRCNHLNFLDCQNSCQPFESQQRTERTAGILGLISKPLCRDSLPKIYNPNGEKQRERLSLDWGCYGLILEDRASILNHTF
jgi:hypothetical protein